MIGGIEVFPYSDEINRIKNQIVDKFDPADIILFGSCAKGRITDKSDIDICVIKNTKDKRKMVMDILTHIDYRVDLDVVVYTPDEWQRYKNDQATFIGIINRTGVSLID